MSNNHRRWRNYWLVHVTSQNVFDKSIETLHFMLISLLIVESVVKPVQLVILYTGTDTLVCFNDVERLPVRYSRVRVTCDDIRRRHRESSSPNVLCDAVCHWLNTSSLEEELLQNSSAHGSAQVHDSKLTLTLATCRGKISFACLLLLPSLSFRNLDLQMSRLPSPRLLDPCRQQAAALWTRMDPGGP